MDKQSNEEKVAHITAKQTIIVTLITALSGVSGAFIQKYSSASNGSNECNENQQWIFLKGVDFFGDQSVIDYRVVIDVDGIPYSYPGRSVWRQSGSEPDSQPFPLPIDMDKHNVRFEVFYKEEKIDSTSVRALNSNIGYIVTVNRKQIKGDNSLQIGIGPFSGHYDVYESRNGTRDSDPKARIYFEIANR